MISARFERHRVYLLACLCLLLCTAPDGAADTTDAAPALDIPPLNEEREAWLVTIAPGEIYWQRFGHNAIWLREPARGLDHTFNFGYFDFEQENFFLRFLTGRMLYQSLAFSASREMAAYAGEGRAVSAQRLDLGPAEYERLRDHLLWHVQPANRDYLYDYFLDNCSTRIRDAIDLAIDGALSAVTREQPAQASFRDHTRRLTVMTFWYYLGLETVLGRPVDRPISRWDEMFIPGILAEAVRSADVLDERGPLAENAVWIYPPAVPESAVGSPWWRYLVASLALMIVLKLGLKGKPALAVGLARAWLLTAALLGLVLLSLWGLTDHRVVGPNANLLLFNPLFLLVLKGKPIRALLPLVAVGGAAALVQGWPIGWQYNLDVVALVLPLNLVAALVLRSSLSAPARPD
jgi:hypothetical protein